jgi:lysophospholipase L1-like esterase
MRKLILLSTLVAALGPGAAAASAAKPTYYLSLGDSLAAGYNKDAAGVTRYNGADYTRRVFKQAARKTKGLRLADFSCPGESTQSMQADRGCPLPRSAADDRAQLKRAVSFLKAHKGRVKYVTLSIGANNFTKCLPGGQLDLGCITAGEQQLRTDLPKIDKALRKAAGPKTRIAHLLLYNPYLSFYLQEDKRSYAQLSDALLKKVNQDIRDAGKPYGLRFADGYGAFEAGDFTTPGSWNGQAVPRNVQRACELSQNCLPAPQGNIHPTSAGYAALAKAFVRALRL